MYFWISAFVTLANAASNCKSFNHEINHKKKSGPTKYLQEKILDPRNTHGKNFGHTKYTSEKISDPQNTHEKKILTHEYPRENYGPTKKSRQKILDP